MLLKILCFISALGSSALTGASTAAVESSPRVSHVLSTAKSPQLLLLGPKDEIQRLQSQFSRLLDVNEAIDLNKEGYLLAEDQGEGRAAGIWVRVRYGLPVKERAATLWVLLGPNGTFLASGIRLPEPQHWTSELHRSGQLSLVERLTRFLRRRPDHLEARYDLVVALQPRLEGRLKALPSKAVEDLEPATDALVWGPLAEAMEPLLQDEAISLFDFSPRMPRECPEARSRIMRELYRNYRRIVQAQVMAFPEGRSGWEMLLRMDRAIGESAGHPSWLEIKYFSSPYHRIDGADLWCRIGDSLAQEARRTGNWRRPLPLLRQFWEFVRLDAAFSLLTGIEDPGGRRAPSPAEVARSGQRDRERAWDCLLLPLLESLVATGAAGEVPVLLSRLDSGWAGLGLDARLKSLSRAVQRPDLLPAWSSAVTNLPPEVPKQGMFVGDLRLFHQNLQNPMLELEIQALLGKQGFSMTSQSTPPEWRRYLGWEADRAHWALIDDHGRTCLQGHSYPPVESIPGVLRNSGWPSPLELVRDFRKENPGQVFPRFYEVAKRQLVCETHWWSRRRQRSSGSAVLETMSMEEKAAWGHYLEGVDELLALPMGLNAHALARTFRPSHCLTLSPADMNEEERKVLDRWIAIGRKHAERLEAEVSRRPGEDQLWEWLLSFQPEVPHDLAGFFQAVEASPAREGSWPSQDLRGRVGKALIKQERWKDAVRILEPGWEAIRGSRSPHGGWEFSENLVLGFVQLGRWADADAVMSLWLERGIGIGNAAEMLQRVRSWGYLSWSDHWLKSIQAANPR